MDNMSSALDSRTEANVPEIILQAVGSTTELVVLTAFLLTCFVAVLFGNGIIFVTVFKNKLLHTQRYFLLLGYAACDTASSVTMYPLAIMVLFQGSNVSEWVCRTFSCLGVSVFLSTVYMLGFLAYERYHFFCRPLSYETFFTSRKLAYVVAAVWLISLGFSVTTELIFGRKLFITVLSCQLELPIISHIQLVGFCAPSLLVIFWSTLRISITLGQMKTKILPQALDPGNKNNTDTFLPLEGLSTTYRAKIRKAGRAIKLIILVSGLFWGTVVQFFISRVIVFSKGVTWEDMETGQDMMSRQVVRYGLVISGTVSQVLNPWLYMYTHPELRSAVRRIMFRSDSVRSEGI